MSEIETLDAIRIFLRAVRGLAGIEDDLVSLVAVRQQVAETKNGLNLLVAERNNVQSAIDSAKSVLNTTQQASSRIIAEAREKADRIIAESDVKAEAGIKRAADEILKMRTNAGQALCVIVDQTTAASLELTDLNSRVAAAKDQLAEIRRQIEALRSV
jgi:cell division septum initiation protein DivIVA